MRQDSTGGHSTTQAVRFDYAPSHTETHSGQVELFWKARRLDPSHNKPVFRANLDCARRHYTK